MLSIVDKETTEYILVILKCVFIRPYTCRISGKNVIPCSGFKL